jgi:hypothetical protein
MVKETAAVRQKVRLPVPCVALTFQRLAIDAQDEVPLLQPGRAPSFLDKNRHR